jgi:hypothetical protein
VVTFPDILGENENNNVPKSDRDPKFLQNMRPNILLPMTGQQVEKVALKTVQKHNNARIMVSVSLVSCSSQQDTPMYETVNLKTYGLDFGKAFDTTWHPH